MGNNRIDEILERAAEESERAATQERIADALERLVIAAESIATALSLQTLARTPYEPGRGKTGEWLMPHHSHSFKPHPDDVWMCETCRGGQGDAIHQDDIHQRPPDGH